MSVGLSLLGLRILGDDGGTIAVQARTWTSVRSKTHYVNVLLPGYGERPFLIDTGASYSAMPLHELQTLASMDQAQFGQTVDAVFLDGESMPAPVYVVWGLVVRGKNASCTLPATNVVGLYDRPARIIGASLLRQVEPYTISFAEAQLMLQCPAPRTRR
jgi:hypothetical protein